MRNCLLSKQSAPESRFAIYPREAELSQHLLVLTIKPGKYEDCFVFLRQHFLAHLQEIIGFFNESNGQVASLESPIDSDSVYGETLVKLPRVLNIKCDIPNSDKPSDLRTFMSYQINNKRRVDWVFNCRLKRGVPGGLTAVEVTIVKVLTKKADLNLFPPFGVVHEPKERTRRAVLGQARQSSRDRRGVGGLSEYVRTRRRDRGRHAAQESTQPADRRLLDHAYLQKWCSPGCRSGSRYGNQDAYRDFPLICSIRRNTRWRQLINLATVARPRTLCACTALHYNIAVAD
jgi:hypothetical protein